MSTRERWIVYPLLFMTLGIALRDKIVPPTHLGNPGVRVEAGEVQAQRLVCNALVVTGPNHEPVVVAGAEVSSGAGMIETFTPKGASQIRLLSTDTGGMVQTIGQGGKAIVVMGHAGQNFGVFAMVPDLGPPIPLTTPLRYQPRPLPGQQPKAPATSGKKPPQEKSEKKEKAGN